MESQRALVISTIKVLEELFRSIKTFLVTAILENLETDSDDEIFMLVGFEADVRTSPIRRRQPPRLFGFSEIVIPRFNTREFQSHFRLHPETANFLENIISPLLARHGDEGRFPVKPRKQMLSVIWLLATPDSYRSIGQKFGMSKSTLHNCFRRVYQTLLKLTPRVIYWPSRSERSAIKNKFQDTAGLPDIIGAIDGCHIEIDAPKSQPEAYRTGKKKYAVQLQAVCTPELIFTDVFAGYPGSVHDSRIFKNSPLHSDASVLFDGNEYIIGDKAYYPVLLWCIPPFKDFGNMTRDEKVFNVKLSKTRQVIERAFALLKGRWRRLKHLSMIRTDEIAPTIVATCTLHNLCLRSMQDTPEDLESYITEGQTNEIGNQTDNDNDLTSDQSSTAAISKREFLKNLVN